MLPAYKQADMSSTAQPTNHPVIAFGISSLAQSILLMNRPKNNVKGGPSSLFIFNLPLLPL